MAWCLAWSCRTRCCWRVKCCLQVTLVHFHMPYQTNFLSECFHTHFTLVRFVPSVTSVAMAAFKDPGRANLASLYTSSVFCPSSKLGWCCKTPWMLEDDRLMLFLSVLVGHFKKGDLLDKDFVPLLTRPGVLFRHGAGTRWTGRRVQKPKSIIHFRTTLLCRLKRKKIQGLAKWACEATIINWPH
jgi:hypothetical protein